MNIPQPHNTLFPDIVSCSASMQSIFDAITRVSQFDTTVLITGESGTGKELIARAIHEHSKRAQKPFITVNCGAIPETLIESELFGYKKGAFTDAGKDKIGLFEEANGGTIFLDEIGDLPLALQAKILRTLQEQQIQKVGETTPIKIDVRIIAATLIDLEKGVAEKSFRKDLYYRLNVLTIHLPPLRVRRDDIEILAYHFIAEQQRKHRITHLKITPNALDALKQYSWPGNIRELENCIERAVVFSENATIDRHSLPETVRKPTAKALRNQCEQEPKIDSLSIKEHTRQIEIDLISKALKQTAGNRTKAAKILDISQRALIYKLKEYGFLPKQKKMPAGK